MILIDELKKEVTFDKRKDLQRSGHAEDIEGKEVAEKNMLLLKRRNARRKQNIGKISLKQ